MQYIYFNTFIGPYSHQADCWSVGVILFVMLFGFPPFYADPLSKNEIKQIYDKICQGFKPKIAKGYGAWFPEKFKISPNARAFIAKLLVTNPSDRMSAKMALDHPWLKEGYINNNNSTNKPDSSDDNTDAHTNINDNNRATKPDSGDNDIDIPNFANADDLKYAISTLFQDVFKSLKRKDFENLKNIFKNFDNNNGLIGFNDFKIGLFNFKNSNGNHIFNMRLYNRLFKNLNNIEKIDWNQLLNAIVRDYLIANDQRLYKAFRDLDLKQNGLISIHDLKKKLKKNSIIEFTDDDLKKFFKEIQTDGDMIDYEHFLR